MSSMTSTGSLQARRSREVTPSNEENQTRTVFLSPQRPTPKYTDPQRTSSSSFKPPMSRELMEKQIKKLETPAQPSTFSSAFSYIKTVFTGRSPKNPTTVSSNASSSIKPPATSAMTKHLEVVKKSLSKVDRDEQLGKDDSQELKVTKEPAKAPVKKRDEIGSPPPMPTILEENKVIGPVSDVKSEAITEKPTRRKPVIPFSFDPKKVRPNANVKDIKDFRPEKVSPQYLPPTILPSRSNENDYDKQRNARMKKIEQFKTRHMVIPPTVLEPDTAQNIVQTYQKTHLDFQSKEFIFPPTEIKTRINTASRSPSMTFKSTKKDNSNKGLNRKGATKSKSQKDVVGRFAFASPQKSKPRPTVIPPTEEPKPYVETTDSGRTTSYRIVSTPPSNDTILRSSNFSPGKKKKQDKTKSPQKNEKLRRRSKSLTRQQVRSKSTPDRMFMNSRSEHVTTKSKSALQADSAVVNKVSSHTSLDDDRDVPRKYTQMKNIPAPRLDSSIKKSSSRDNQSPSIRRSLSKDPPSPRLAQRSTSNNPQSGTQMKNIPAPRLDSSIKKSSSRDNQSPSIRRSLSKDPPSPRLAQRSTSNNPQSGQRSMLSERQSPALARRSMSHEPQSPGTSKNIASGQQSNISYHRSPGLSISKPHSPKHQKALKTQTNRKNSPPKSFSQHISSGTGYSSVKRSPSRPFTNRSLGDSSLKDKDKQKPPSYKFSSKRQLSPSKSLSSFQSSRHPSQSPMPSRNQFSNKQKLDGQKKQSKWAFKNQISSPKASNSGNQSAWKIKNKQSPKQQRKNLSKARAPVFQSPPMVKHSSRKTPPLRPSSPVRLSPVLLPSQEAMFDQEPEKEQTIPPFPPCSPKISGSSHIVMTSPPHVILSPTRDSSARLSPKPEFQPQQPIGEIEMSISPAILEALGGKPQCIQPESVNLGGNLNMSEATNLCQKPIKHPPSAESNLQMDDTESHQNQKSTNDSSEPDFNNSSANLSDEIDQHLQKIQKSWTAAPSFFVEEDLSSSESSYILTDTLSLTNDESDLHHISFISHDLMINLWDESDCSNSSLYNPSLHDDEQIFTGMSDNPTFLSETPSDKILGKNKMFQDESEQASRSKKSVSPVVMAGTSKNQHPNQTNFSGIHHSAFSVTKEKTTGTSVKPSSIQVKARTNSWQYDQNTSFDREVRKGQEKNCPSCTPIRSKPITRPGKLSPNQIPLGFKNLNEVTSQGHSRQRLTYRTNKQNTNMIRKDIKIRSPATKSSPVKYRDDRENFPPKQSQYASYGRTAASSAVGAAFRSTGTRKPKSETKENSDQDKSPVTDDTDASTDRQSSPKEVIKNTISFFSSMFKGKEKVPAELDNQEAKKIENKEENFPQPEYSSDGLPHSTFQESLKRPRPIPSWRSPKVDQNHEPIIIAQKPAVLSPTKKDPKPAVHSEKVFFPVKKDQKTVAMSEKADLTNTENPKPPPRYSGDPDDFTWSSTTMGETP